MDTNATTKFESFLFRDQKRQMVRGEFISYRSVGRDAEVVKLVSQLQEQTGREDGMFMIYYATRRLYTVSLEFDWHKDTPEYLKNLETYWEGVQAGEQEAELYLYYINNLHNAVGQDWTRALDSAQRLWKPPEEGWDDEEDENGEVADPNS